MKYVPKLSFLKPLFNKILERLINLNYNVEIETNGSILIKDYVNNKNISYTLDYKLPGSLMENKMNLDNYRYISKKDSVKFVCKDYNDLLKMKEIINKYDLINITNCIVSPVFNEINLEDIVNFLIDNNLNGVKMQLQIHKIIWNPNKRGV